MDAANPGYHTMMSWFGPSIAYRQSYVSGLFDRYHAGESSWKAQLMTAVMLCCC